MSDVLQQAIVAIQTGNKTHAGQLLTQILQTDPHNVSAWIWLSWIANTEERRRACLDQALAIDPSHQEVRQALLDWIMAKEALSNRTAEPDQLPQAAPTRAKRPTLSQPTQPTPDLTSIAGTSLQDFLAQLSKNYHLLQEREAKYGSTAAPLDLLNQIDDYKCAIDLTEEAINRAAPLEELQAEFGNLNLQISTVVFVTQEPPRKPFKGLNPYRGLLKFTENDAQFFFGRNDAIQSLLSTVQYLAETETGPQSPDLIAVLGPSGSGKSSLVRAGLVPALGAGRVPGSQRWPVKVMQPGPYPLDALAEVFVGQVGQNLAAIRASLNNGERALHELVVETLALAREAEVRVFVLVIDQFEEAFTLCQDEAERRAFIDQLLYATQVSHNRSFVILTMRSDLYSKLATYKPLAVAVTGQQMLVSPMTEKELREAILLPAEAVGLELEKALVECLVNDTANAPGVLPLLQHALLELFQRRDGNLLTLAAYNEIGGVKGALAHRADSVINELTAKQQKIARRIFLCLVQLGEGAADTRRRASLDEALAHDSSREEVEAVVGKLTEANLIITDRNPETNGVMLDVAHEALIREWPLLRHWLNENRQSLHLQQELSQAAHKWEARDHSPDYLYTGARLLEADSWAAAHPDDVNPFVGVFIQASVEARDREAREKEEQRQHELKQAKTLAEEKSRSANIFRRFAFGLAAVVVVALVLAGFALYQRSVAEKQKQVAEVQRQRAQEQEQLAITQRQRAEQEAHRAQAGQLAAQARASLSHQFDLGLLLGLESYNLMQDAGLTDTLMAQSSILAGVAGNPYLRTFLQGHSSQVNSLAFSPNRQILASSSYDGSIILWDVEQARPLGAPLRGHQDYAVTRLAFRPTPPESSANSSIEAGREILASAGDDGAILLWDLSQEPPVSLPLKEPGDTPVTSLAFTPDGQTLASGDSNGTIILWNLTTDPPSQQQLPQGYDNVVDSLAFSADGRLLATASSVDQTIRLWDLATYPPSAELLPTEHEDGVLSLAFSPTEPILASASKDESVILWDVNKKEPLDHLSGHSDWVNQVAFGPAGSNLMASVGDDNQVIIWDVEDHSQLAILSGHGTGAVSIAFNFDGAILASGGRDSTIILWDATQPLPLGKLFSPENGHAWTRAAFQPKPVAGPLVSSGVKSQILALGQADGSVILWDAAAGQQVGQPLTADKTEITSLAFSPDGQRLATGSTGHRLILWDLTKTPPSGQPLSDDHSGSINSLAFSPNGQWLAVGNGDNSIILWNLTKDPPSGQPFPEGHTATVNSVAFSPDSRTLASAGDDGTVVVWDLAAPAQNHILWDHKSGVNSVAFSPATSESGGSQLLASASQDTTIILWDLAQNPPTLKRILKGHGDSVLGVAFSPDGQFLASGDYDGNVLLWDVQQGQQLGDPLTEQGYSIGDVAFSPDGQTLASVSWDSLILREINLTVWQELACRRANRNLSQAEWNQFIGSDRPYHRTCPNLPLDPVSYAAVVEAQARAGDISGALASFQEVQKQYPNLPDPADAWNDVCWYGSLWEHAAEVLDACEQAVTLAPDYSTADFRDSRGVARTMTGDRAGAIEDFLAFVEAYKTDETLQADVTQREAWIAELQAGRNPFDPATLAELRKE